MERAGVVFPTRNADTTDFEAAAAAYRPAMGLQVIDLAWPGDTGETLAEQSDDELVASLRALGTPDRLRAAVAGAPRPLAAIALGVTSASFLLDDAGHRRQLAALSAAADCPATSTTRGFQEAVRGLGLRRVSVASVYPPICTDAFVEHIALAGARTVARVDADARSDAALAAWSDAQILELVAAARHPQAEAILLPETALHTHRLQDRLEAAAGVPVLTATRVTLDSLHRLLAV